MRLRTVLFSRLHLAALLCVLIQTTVVTADILTKPENKTVALNQTNATFNCQVTGTIFGWTINGESADDAQLQQSGVYTSDKQNGSMINSTLFIPAIIRFNNSIVICRVAGSSRALEESDPAMLKIQGLLTSPPNLRVEYSINEYHSQLQWDAPFTLDITDVDPDISGYTFCNNVTAQCINVTYQFFQFPIICSPVLFSVSAVNTVGTGASAYYEYTLPQQLTSSAQTGIGLKLAGHLRHTIYGVNIETETSFNSNHIPTVTISFQDLGGCYYFIDVNLTSTYSNTQSVVGPILPTVDSSGIASLTISDLPDNDIITAIVTEHTEELWSLETTFLTFDVMAVDIEGGDGSIDMVCIFARGSNAQGCYVVLLSMDGKVNQSERVLRELDNGYPTSTSAFSISLFDLEPGNYSVAIFDIEFDGSVLVNRAAFIATFTVSGLTDSEIDIILGSLFGSIFGLLILICCFILCWSVITRFVCQMSRKTVTITSEANRRTRRENILNFSETEWRTDSEADYAL